MQTEITATFLRSLINTRNDELYTAVHQSVPPDRFAPRACHLYIYTVQRDSRNLINSANLLGVPSS